MEDQEKQDIRDQINRLFQHGLHEDNVFTERSNYFLMAESLLVVAYTGLLSGMSAGSSPAKAGSIIGIARTLAAFGFLLTILWIYVNQRQRYVLKHIKERAREILPEYKVTYETRNNWRISSTWLMAYAVPLLIAVMWAVFIVLPLTLREMG